MSTTTTTTTTTLENRGSIFSLQKKMKSFCMFGKGTQTKKILTVSWLPFDWTAAQWPSGRAASALIRGGWGLNTNNYKKKMGLAAFLVRTQHQGWTLELKLPQDTGAQHRCRSPQGTAPNVDNEFLTLTCRCVTTGGALAFSLFFLWDKPKREKAALFLFSFFFSFSVLTDRLEDGLFQGTFSTAEEPWRDSS